MFGYTLKTNHINLETFMNFFLGFWQLKTSKITLFSNLFIFYFAFCQWKKRLMWNPLLM